MPSKPLICFYGDDFTGSTDALAQFHRFGLRGRLFFRLPTEPNVRAAARELDVVGVAGISRSLPTERMDPEVRPALEWFAELGSPLVQYKICSTFDSSPTRGSFGRAIAIGRDIFGAKPVPILAAQPEFGRYTVFGNHFARAGAVFRLDRHPTMSRHPSTPMREADLRAHLAQQTDLPIELMDIVTLSAPSRRTLHTFRQLVGTNPGAIVIDALENKHLTRAAELIWPGETAPPVFALGSGGLSYGVGDYLHRTEQSSELRSSSIAPVDRVLVVSGSCAPQTAAQIRHAVSSGWRALRLPVGQLINPLSRQATAEDAQAQALSALVAGHSLIVYTALGPDDASLGETRTLMEKYELTSEGFAKIVGHAFGRLMQRAVEDAGVRRLLVAGGDTSGYTMHGLDAYAIEIESNFVVAGALCRLCSTNPNVEGVQIMLKGGQVGGEDLFEAVRMGGVARQPGEGRTR